MILKASSRANGANLAAHLLRLDENDHVCVQELRGFAGSDLHEAFQEAQAISRATKCKNYLFSLSLNPPQDATPTAEDFTAAADMIEKRLGFEGQPRALVIHEKQGRMHAHCVWSRIDAATMTARPLDFYKTRLQGVSRELYLQYGWQMPHGLIDSAKRDPGNFTLAEWQQAKRLGQDPRWIKQIARACWARSDGKAAFEKSLAEHAMFLARGDRRGFVILDHMGEVHSLSRVLDVKQREVGARLGDPAALPGVDEAQKALAAKLVPAIQRHIRDTHVAVQKMKATNDLRRTDLVQCQRDERERTRVRQQSEFERETRERAARLPTGLRGLWHRLTGKYQATRLQNENEAEASRLRQQTERQAMVERQMRERRSLEVDIQNARKRKASILRGLRQDVGRFLINSRAYAQTVERARGLSSPMNLQR